MQNLQIALQKTIDHLKSEYAALQLGRANASLVEEILVEAYGSPMALKGTANIACPDAKTIKIEPWDKTLMAEIEKAIIAADLGLNPQNNGESIILPIPPMTEERRQQVSKKAKEIAENAKISVRNARQDELKNVKAQKEANEISEDEQKRLEKQVQDKIDETNKTIDDMSKNKEQEIMTV